MVTSSFWDRLNKLDFSLVTDKLTSKEYGLGWSEERAKQAISRYKLFLFLRFIYPQVSLAPTVEIDEVWHTHILVDTYQYMQDCQNLYGYILHHRFAPTEQNTSQNFNWMDAKLLLQKYLGTNIWDDTDTETAPCIDLPIYPHLPTHLSACMTLPTPYLQTQEMEKV
ncbi:glycine-rich domain-containing protein [Calothrix sp. NIES-3974]|uniref:glycine-rich domain-containing protein n=1 Tax=Calothrix sp. NIES-3974 TaxID=2005462 RepID=UPI000B615F1B|nr:glycine-rich domain-containing protein-like [Calothrix sp. NIES-3974]BAZ04944.1 hypothetical protein NIES3974_15900 [Calothrix sp. NIES-3974]